MAPRPLVSLLLLVLLSLTVSVPRGVQAADPLSDDPVAIVDAQLAAVPLITPQCSSDAAVLWLDRVGEIFARIASGGLPALPPSAASTVETLGSTVVTTDKFTADARVVTKAVALLPSLWAAGFFYSKPATWKPVLSSFTTPLTILCKANAESNDALVNATSLAIRFTKDTVFFNGEDSGDTISNVDNKGFIAWLAELVASVSKADDFTLSESQLRAYMNTLPSKRDGMDTKVAFPVFVDTAIYKASDAAALRKFLRTPLVAAQ